MMVGIHKNPVSEYRISVCLNEKKTKKLFIFVSERSEIRIHTKNVFVFFFSNHFFSRITLHPHTHLTADLKHVIRAKCVNVCGPAANKRTNKPGVNNQKKIIII